MKAKTFFAALATLLLVFVMIVDAKGMIAAVQGAILTCLETIIPSLFGFMIISTFLIRSGLGNFILRPLHRMLRYIFRLSEDEFSVLVLSLIGGFPVGAKLIADMTAKNPAFKKQGEQMLAFCYCTSPTFAISIIGLKLYNSLTLGLLVYLSNMTACLILAAYCNRKRDVPPRSRQRQSITISKEILTDSAMSAASSMVSVCTMILLFAIIEETVRFVLADLLAIMPAVAPQILFGLLEISNVSDLPKYAVTLLIPIAGMMSFGGVCIFMQVSTIASGRLSLKKFALWRIPAALISMLIMAGYVLLAKPSLAVSASAGNVHSQFTGSGNIFGSIILIFMSFILISVSASGKKT